MAREETMPKAGLEPARVAPHAFEARMSTISSLRRKNTGYADYTVRSEDRQGKNRAPYTQ